MDPERATQIENALVNHYGRADMSETDNKVRFVAGCGRMVGINAVVSDVGKAERSSKGPGKA